MDLFDGSLIVSNHKQKKTKLKKSFAWSSIRDMFSVCSPNQRSLCFYKHTKKNLQMPTHFNTSCFFCQQNNLQNKQKILTGHDLFKCTKWKQKKKKKTFYEFKILMCQNVQMCNFTMQKNAHLTKIYNLITSQKNLFDLVVRLIY